MSVKVSEKEANYLQKKVDFGIQTGTDFFGFIKFQIESGSEPSSAISLINLLKDCKDGNTIQTSTSMMVGKTKTLGEQAEKAGEEIKNLKDSIKRIGDHE